MKTIKIIIAFFLITLGSGNYLSGQSPDAINPVEGSVYRTAIGMRAGGTSGLTIKQFTSERMALEGILGIWPNSLSLTGLLEFYAPSAANGLSWYYGFGGHLAFETARIYYARDDFRYVNREAEVGLGIDGIVGIEYKIVPIPVALSLDVKPFIEVNTKGLAFMALDPGLGIKFAF